ncbi:MAG: hypothetical protein ACRETK_00375, partial [Steroidobacteraceae bacterium]
YLLDERGDLPARVNRQMVGIEALEDEAEIAGVRSMIERHLQHTGSTRARQVLEHWDQAVKKFVRIMPRDFKRAVASLQRAHAQGLSGDEAVMAAFEENARDLARVGGN